MIPTFIPYGKQNISQADIDAVVDVLKSDFLTQGPQVPKFEQAVANYCKAEYGIATCNATAALHIACLALDVGINDIVWTSPISFVASANCALYCGAKIDFVDINLNSGNMSIKKLKEKLELAKKNNSLPKVVIPVHLAGLSCEMREINQLAKQYNFRVIEDASHAVGGKYQNQPIGNCQYSDITIFSFHPVKIITTAEGGIALTNDSKLAQQLELLRSHGITSNQELMTEKSHGPWYYQQIALGFNYRMTELQAALGLSQVKRLNEFVKQRNQIAAVYDEAFVDSSLSILKPAVNSYSSYHLYIILLPLEKKNQHKEIIEALRNDNICAHLHYIPIHTQPYYQALGFNNGDFENAEKYYSRAISLPLYYGLSNKNQQYIIKKVKEKL
ncbi:MAG: UDP-4-amino-4,6-dideoxy-N-acetyl-beta-L-altrosamine transaminase [Colwellia sp.]|nr:UDP-4-amino-4,6-dideoxy-N-acetyl-beta-L-altrosamine transaminase [Colwellia sp.]NQZ80635.1 UDP-4-amino-4,6-dideoxy-N-acetyl-beta-L-altrosamine transaminase [Colwellia sp.]